MATEAKTKADYGSKGNPLTSRDALALAHNELERVCCALEDLGESARSMIQLAQMQEGHEEYAAFLRIFERVLNAEFDECSKVSERVFYALQQARKDDGADK